MRFKIRSLMIAVVAVGGLLALLRDWSALVPVFVLVVMPLAGLTGLRNQVPPHRPSWRFGISAVMLGLIILGTGWFCARSLVWYFQRQEGFEAIGAARDGYYEFWGMTIPSLVTGICLLAYVLFLTVACTPRRRRVLLPVVVAYALALAGAYVLLFAFLGFEAFD